MQLLSLRDVNFQVQRTSFLFFECGQIIFAVGGRRLDLDQKCIFSAGGRP
jgi:hypothetical protein